MEELQTRKATFSEAFRFWVKLGFISFGGPTGQIAIMHTELVEKKRWINEPRFLHALNYCMFLPGPEAQQLAIYIGWLLHRTTGGIVAGAFFVLPSIFLMWMLSYIYVEYGNVTFISSIFYGLKGAVTAIIAVAVLRIGKRVLKNEAMWLIAAGAFVAIFFFEVPFPLIVLSAAVMGLVGGKILPQKFLVVVPPSSAGGSLEPLPTEEHTKPSWRRAFKVLIVCLALWWLPILLIGLRVGWNHTLFREGVFFSKAAMVTFGGAYAVLPYVAQQAENDHWLEPGQMMDGLGLAETTPGPLIMVVQFVGFLAAWNQPQGLPTLTAATLGALISTWATFLPCFLWIFLGAPHIEQMRGNTKLTSSLSAVTAAIVGVVLNLAVSFASHSMFPVGWNVDWFLLSLSVAGFIVMAVWKLDIIPVVLLSAMFGLWYRLIQEGI
ncbi:chromate efflux transporter [bacterium]|nr:chromate efflux transporter [bacterium]MCI0603355.1 chromate efflux transporter [bacterium]